MFGYIIVNKPEMKFREFDVYHGYYCGLCRKLKEHYGKFGQITLSYDMVFVLMTLTSLYEPETTKSMKRCVTHPLHKHEERVNNITDYVAHMNILLTYYKCKDDWNDDRKLEKLVLEKILYHKSGFSRNFYREKWNKINDILEKLSEEEKKDNQDIDQMSGMFGKVMAEIMLFVLVGATVDLHYAASAGIAAVVLILGVLIFRMAGVWCCMLGTNLNKKERIFCMFAYMPKATVQAAIGGMPLAMGLSCGNIVLTVAVLSILITAPLGAFLIDATYRKLL